MVAVASVVTLGLAVAVDMDLLEVLVRLQSGNVPCICPPSSLLLTWGGRWDGQRRMMVVVMRKEASVTSD